MKNWMVLLFGLLTLIGCDQTDKDALTIDNASTLMKQSKKYDNKKVPEEFLTLNTELKSDATIESIDENLFGKFYGDRAEFYIIKNPQNKILESQPESLTLFYLDGKLRQTKYLLNDNIVTKLIREHGGFKITGLDHKNSEIIADKQVVIKTDKGIRFNDKLDNYELKWTVGEKEIKYCVSAEDKDKFEYIERVKSHKTETKAVEKYSI